MGHYHQAPVTTVPKAEPLKERKKVKMFQQASIEAALSSRAVWENDKLYLIDGNEKPKEPQMIFVSDLQKSSIICL